MARAKVKINLSNYESKSAAFWGNKNRTPHKENFNFDLERMKKHIESETVEIPDCNSFEDFKKWLAT